MKLVSVTGMLSALAHLAGVLTGTTLNPFRFYLSLGGFLSSAVIFWWAISTTWAHRLLIAFSTEKPDSLICRGPYWVVRHPLYLAYTLAWMAGAAAIPHWWPWIVVVVMEVQYVAAIFHEERQFLAGPCNGS